MIVIAIQNGGQIVSKTFAVLATSAAPNPNNLDIFIRANCQLKMQILVYSDRLSPRVSYIFRHVFANMLGVDYAFTQSKNEFVDYPGCKIAYSLQRFEDVLSIAPHGLLFEEGFSKPVITIEYWRNLPIFFKAYDDSAIPFDVFSAAFYLISRYEEYIPFKPDLHGRFSAQNSLAFTKGFLDIPLVDLWIKELSKILCAKYPEFSSKPLKAYFLPTIDIDNAYAYKHKGFIHNSLALIRSLLFFRFSDIMQRIMVTLRFADDPYDSYARLFNILKPYPNAIWFILGGRKSKYDRNISMQSRAMRRLIKEIASRFRVGVHPSYAAGVDYARVKGEFKELSDCLETNISSSRQHFLRLQFPRTYRILNDLGISEDYSMGYSTHIGFRASTSIPFNFYDLVDEKELPLKIFPFVTMDLTLLNVVGSYPVNSVIKVVKLAKQVKEVGGTFVIIWHNESLSGRNEWKGWENSYGEIVAEVASVFES